MNRSDTVRHEVAPSKPAQALQVVQGAYYVKGFAKHGPLHNPYTYGYLDHVPYKNFKGGHVTCGGIIYQGDAYPKEYQDQYIAGNLLSTSTIYREADLSAASAVHLKFDYTNAIAGATVSVEVSDDGPGVRPSPRTSNTARSDRHAASTASTSRIFVSAGMTSGRPIKTPRPPITITTGLPGSLKRDMPPQLMVLR